jgi:hypothetical protein
VVQQWTLLLVSQSFRKIQTAMLIAAALIEGIGFAALCCLIKIQKTIVGWL